MKQMRFLEQATGIEPAAPAWEAGVLPLDYIRTVYMIIALIYTVCQEFFIEFRPTKSPRILPQDAFDGACDIAKGHRIKGIRQTGTLQ